MNVPAWVFTEWFIAMAASKSGTDRPGFTWVSRDCDEVPVQAFLDEAASPALCDFDK